MRRLPFGLAVTAISLGLLGYFGWHGLEGKRSYANYQKLELRIAGLEADLEAARGQRLAFDHRTSLLRPETVDPDMVDELARELLGFAAAGELVVHEGQRTGTPPQP